MSHTHTNTGKQNQNFPAIFHSSDFANFGSFVRMVWLSNRNIHDQYSLLILHSPAHTINHLSWLTNSFAWRNTKIEDACLCLAVVLSVATIDVVAGFRCDFISNVFAIEWHVEHSHTNTCMHFILRCWCHSICVCLFWIVVGCGHLKYRLHWLYYVLEESCVNDAWIFWLICFINAFSGACFTQGFFFL